MNLLWWRKNQRDEAREALEGSYRDRVLVEKLVRSLFIRQQENNFAPLFEEAFRLKGDQWK